MRITTALSALPVTLPGSNASPQCQKSKEAMTAYAAKFQEFDKDIKKFVKVLEDAKKATKKSEASYQQIIAQTKTWTSRLSPEMVKQDELAQLELDLSEQLINLGNDYDDEILKQARKFKVSMLNEIQKALRSARESWHEVNHYGLKVKNLGKKSERDIASPKKAAILEDKLERNEKKLSQSITVAAQWDKELKQCGALVDQAWITVIAILRDFTAFENRSSSDIRELKSKIDTLIGEVAVYAREQEMTQPLSSIVDETERTFSFPFEKENSPPESALSRTTKAKSTGTMRDGLKQSGIGGLVLSFRKIMVKKEKPVEKESREPVSVDSLDEDDNRRVVEYGKSVDSFFRKVKKDDADAEEKNQVVEDLSDEKGALCDSKEPDQDDDDDDDDVTV